jgi:putative membrane protein
MAEKRTVKEYFGLFGKGALIGVANTVPGVSGGTIAVVTGIYDELMEGIAHFLKNWKFLAVLIAGAGVGILIFARLIEYLFAHYPAQTLYSFIGLILGGIPFLWHKADFGKKIKPVWIVSFLLGFIPVLLMGLGTEPGETTPITQLTLASALLIFLAGTAGAGAMIIPGVSGSFLLLLMGMYSTFITAVNDMNLPVLFVACLGVAAGILVVARIMTFFLTKFPKGTYAVIFGLVLGSLVALWPGLSGDFWGILSLLFIPMGALAGYLLGDR